MLRRRVFATNKDFVSGQVVFASASGVGIYCSYDFGVTFEKATQVAHDYFYAIKMSGNGKHVLIVGSQYVQVSHDYGATFRKIPARSNQCRFASISGDGKIGVIIDNSNFYDSLVWKLNLQNLETLSTHNSGRPLGEVGVDLDATHMCAPIRNGRSVYITINGGNTWTHLNLSQSGTIDYRLTGMSLSGRYVLMTGFLGTAYPPRRYHGSTYSGWKIWGVRTAGVGVSVSPDGKMQCLYAGRGLYISKDYGVTFSKAELPEFTSINTNSSYGFSVSDDEKHIYVCGDSGSLWHSHDYGASFNKLTPIRSTFNYLATA